MPTKAVVIGPKMDAGGAGTSSDAASGMMRMPLARGDLRQLREIAPTFRESASCSETRGLQKIVGCRPEQRRRRPKARASAVLGEGFENLIASSFRRSSPGMRSDVPLLDQVVPLLSIQVISGSRWTSMPGTSACAAYQASRLRVITLPGAGWTALFLAVRAFPARTCGVPCRGSAS